jgi:hypothetical protein
MPNYLSRLWDDYSKIVLANARDFDSRDADYDEKVAEKVWQTVQKLRERREAFRALIRAELRLLKK